jgi:hypothetical protein
MRLVALLGFAGVTALGMGCSATPRAEPDTAVDESVSPTDEATDRLSQAELQDMVMRMADEFYARITETALKLEMIQETPLERAAAHTLKYNLAAAVFDIAVSPQPEEALLDMLVLVLLERTVFERFWGPEYFPVNGDLILETLRKLEQNFWHISSRVLSRCQQDDLRGLIATWLEDNPETIFVSPIRFKNFVALRDNTATKRARGLLAEVGDATRAVDQVRLTGERAMWLSTRLPRLAGYQVEQTLFDLALQPEIQRLQSNYDRMTEASERFVAAVEALPENVRRERVDAIDHFMDSLSAERRAFMDDLEAGSEHLSTVTHELRLALEAGIELSDSLNETVSSVDRVVARFDESKIDPKREPLKMGELRDAAIETRLAADQLTTMLETSNQILASPEWDLRISNLDTAMDRVEAGGNKWINLTFRQGLILIGVVFAALVAYRWISGRLIKS